MIHRSNNPFIYGTIEHEMNSTLYLPTYISDYATTQPMIFMGNRGTGKTSILMSLTWEVAWKISKMIIFVDPKIEDMFRDPKHLGVKIRFVDMDIGYWESWKKFCGKECAQKFFGTYIEMLLLDCFLNAIQKIRRKNKKYFLDVKAEETFVKEMINICFPSKYFQTPLFNFSFESLRSIVRDTHIGLRDLVYRKAGEKSIMQSYPVVGPGNVIQSLGMLFIENYEKLSDWILMPLLDDCHLLTEWQTEVINSSIAKSKAPIAYKLTSVIDLYKSRLNISKHPLSEHDLKTILVNYDGAKDKNYQNLIKNICKSRISQFYGKEYSSQFNVEELLGKFNVEELLKTKLENSENEDALKLLKKAKSIAENKHKSLSITSVWLSDKDIREEKEIKSEDPFIQKQIIRKNESSYKNKFKHVAAVAICKEFHFYFPYSGWEVVLNLSNGSIREVLRIMFEIWEKADMDIDKFITQKPLKWIIQTQAIKKASELSFDSINKKMLNNESSFPKICERLGNLFSQFQSYPYLCTDAESASVKLKLNTLDAEIIDIINQSVMSGFILKKPGKEKGTTEIGLHPILAPKFEINFRNPFFSSESISREQIKIIFLGSDENVTKTIDQILLKRLIRYNKKYDKNLKNVGKKFRSSGQIELNFK